MTIFLNGSFLPAEEASISVHDRGFLYGDGVFETIRVHNGHPFCWHRHWKRLYDGAGFLGIPIPFSETELLNLANELINRNRLSDATLRITLTRGPGPRGYSPSGASTPTLLISLAALPAEPKETGWRLITSQYRVNKDDPLLRYKTCNRLLNVLAKHEAEVEGADDALLLNQEGEVTETTSANLFWIQGEAIGTPALGAGMLPGVTRDLVLDLAAKQGVTVREEPVTLEQIKQADAVFLTVSSKELPEVARIDKHTFPGSSLVDRLRHLYRERLHQACSVPKPGRA